MKSRVEDGKYVIAGVSFEAKEADSPFEPDSKRYRIIDAVVDSQGANGARFVLEARASTRGMRYVDRNLQSVRAVTRGSGWYLGVMPSEQLVLHKVKADEDMTIGLSRGSVDCFVADERGMEMVDISWPPFEPKMPNQGVHACAGIISISSSISFIISTSSIQENPKIGLPS